MSRVWKPGDGAMVTARWIRTDDHSERYAVRRLGGWRSRVGVEVQDWEVSKVRPLVVIDTEGESAGNDISRLCALIGKHHGSHGAVDLGLDWCSLQAALREFADPKPPKPAEPTDPTARVTDRRENIWRLLADGDWVCTSGPDIGEYIAWSRLVADRGPLEVTS